LPDWSDATTTTLVVIHCFLHHAILWPLSKHHSRHNKNTPLFTPYGVVHAPYGAYFNLPVILLSKEFFKIRKSHSYVSSDYVKNA
jgi:hypothetical protein